MSDLFRVVDLDDGSSTVPLDRQRRYAVYDWLGNPCIGPCSHAEAWRFVDRNTGDPVSASEKRGQFGRDRT